MSASQRREILHHVQRQEEGWLARFLWREVVLEGVRRGESVQVASDRADGVCEAWRKRFGTTELDPSGQPRFGSEA